MYKIKFKGKEYDASPYQESIFTEIKNGTSNLIINASAGASKTSTIVNSLQFIPNKKKVLYIAFNKDIVETINSLVDRDNCKIATFHSLGRSILIENSVISEHTPIDEFKYSNYVRDYISTLGKKMPKKQYNSYLKNVKDLVNYSRYYLSLSEKEIGKTAALYGIALIDDEIKVCRDVLLWGKENTDTIDYTDMIWYITVKNLATRQFRYDWIFVDEIQDMSVMQQSIISKCMKRGCRFVGVGDEEQAINVWCGSSLQSIEILKQKSNTKELQLPISYRCPKSIVKLASKYSNRIKAFDNAIEGSINYDVSKYAPIGGDMVLCRCTAPLIELHIEYLQRNKPSYIRGASKIKDRFIQLCSSSNAKLLDRNCITSNGFFPELYSNLFKLIECVICNFNLTEEEAIKHSSVMQLYDDINGLMALSEGLLTLDELITKINDVLTCNEEQDAIQLSTIHKAKGLEADNVYILMPSLLPSKLATKDWEIKTEKNLTYVAVTRAKQTLNFIHEDAFFIRRYVKSSAISILSDLDAIKKKLNYNVEMEIKAPSNITSPHKMVHKLGEIPQKTTESNKKSKKGGQKFGHLL